MAQEDFTRKAEQWLDANGLSEKHKVSLGKYLYMMYQLGYGAHVGHVRDFLKRIMDET